MKHLAILLVIACLMGVPTAMADDEPKAEALERGKAIAFDRNKGNCLACHVIAGGELAGNYGPPLLLMKVRYPNKSDLRAQIWDAGVKDPTTRMPPYGRHRILTEAEIDLVVDFIHTL